VRGVEKACKHIEHPLLHFARACCHTSSVVTPWGYENNWFPLHSLTSSCIITIVFPSSSLFLKREREKKAKMKGKLGIEFS
jgi:hypothetical protein